MEERWIRTLTTVPSPKYSDPKLLPQKYHQYNILMCIVTQTPRNWRTQTWFLRKNNIKKCVSPNMKQTNTYTLYLYGISSESYYIYFQESSTVHTWTENILLTNQQVIFISLKFSMKKLGPTVYNSIFLANTHHRYDNIVV